MGYLDCSCERKHTFVHRERKTPGELNAFFSLQLASNKAWFATPFAFYISKKRLGFFLNVLVWILQLVYKLSSLCGVMSADCPHALVSWHCPRSHVWSLRQQPRPSAIHTAAPKRRMEESCSHTSTHLFSSWPQFFSPRLSAERETLTVHANRRLRCLGSEERMLQDSLGPKVILTLSAPLPNLLFTFGALLKSFLKQRTHSCSIQQN